MEVLLVDDQALTIQVYAAAVRKTFSGARVHMAVDLPEALQIAAGHPLDLVLLDLTLPTCSGIDALYRFRQAYPHVPVLVVCNMTPTPRHNYRIGVPRAGAWREIMNTDSRFYGGSDMGNGGALHTIPQASHGETQSLDLTLPPLSTLYLRPES